ncbi:ABC-type multidrug transport system, ATPase component [Catalinimonas alkaloidigena]|uniref:ABC-type multidrug transport system, ATPase component n=1 Tax=Catalinimonas alkaloidigena TaxID=1075417 RepID=A0A1G8Y135_9BACT|nr:ATP-binding cassette domain-containing protein [Catalinimonas alkaloidigena]SDJ96506.1 ABC-type multidrug transport system, ATPase component [Catalinimonas alkaloidigena]
MSEEILQALTQLFGIITKQDGGVTEKERAYVIRFFQQQLNKDKVEEYVRLYDKYVGYGQSDAEEEEDAGGGTVVKVKKERKLTSVRDSVRTLALCKKINKTLAQKQKVIALIKLLELVNEDQNFTPQRKQIIDTVSEVFNISQQEYKLIEDFVLCQTGQYADHADLLVVDAHDHLAAAHVHHMHSTGLEGEIMVLKVASVDMYFLRYLGHSELTLNGFTVIPNQVYLFPHGSTLKAAKGEPLYYGDVVGHFVSDATFSNLSFNVDALEFRFPNGHVGLHDVNISEGPGKLIAIMGASGAGKTTLLNVLAGLETPSKGHVLINGIDLHKEKDKIQGMIGYVAQDDLLIEELTVFQNLYYNAKLCFKDLSEEELTKRVDQTLASLGLGHIKHLVVGNVLNKKISGGQRKRLNIALELIREPAVLFVDEPTSGLSSRDSENVIDLLKELSLKGKLIFVVIHQPSSDIYKMFDKIFIMDTGGYPIFYGHPVEAVSYFKRATHQIDADRGQCHTCGNVNPEQIFNIIEAHVVDEYGQFTNERKMTPTQWSNLYAEKFTTERRDDVRDALPQALSIPKRFKQFVVFTTRDLLSKVTNTQYLAINLLEAPLLAFLLAFIIRFQNSTDGTYVFRFNDNIPAFILMSVVVALFMGLTVSAEEIIRDRKIQRRESFLNLSRSSYLMSKVTILFLLSAIQTLTFVMIGNWILGIQGMHLSYWFILFTVSCFANMLGLNISASFNSAVTIYILIPLLLIPQLILSGAIFNFDKLNQWVSTKGKTPLIADMMASRWGFEALTVHQFNANRYQRMIAGIEKEESLSNYLTTYLIPELETRLKQVEEGLHGDAAQREEAEKNLRILQNELTHPALQEHFSALDLPKQLSPENFNEATAEQLRTSLAAAGEFHKLRFTKANEMKDGVLMTYENNPNRPYSLAELKNRYYNESLNELVRNATVKNRVVEWNDQLLRQTDPIYHEPTPDGLLDYRAHFYAPRKHLFGLSIDTFWFNALVIWLMTAALYLTLYHESFKKLIDRLGSLPVPKIKLPGLPLSKIQSAWSQLTQKINLKKA